MYDNQVPFTVYEAITMADNPDDLTIGLVLMETGHEEIDYEFYYQDKLVKLLEYPQVKFKRFKVGEYKPSVGFGRDQALSMYTDEDYILQVDSHTLFQKGWDTALINMYKGALEKTNNPKTILTCYLPGYRHNNNTRYPVLKEQLASYPIFTFRTWFETEIPAWTDSALTGPSATKYRSDEVYVPCVKFNAQFVFSNKNYIGNTGLAVDTIFWEEELFQTINLLDAGFSLVFPNMVMPVAHLFQNDVDYNAGVLHPSYRVSGANPGGLPDAEYKKGMKDNWYKFINDPDNKDKVEKFCKYTKLNLRYGPFKEGYIPKDFNR
jgi:hypothetical protein